MPGIVKDTGDYNTLCQEIKSEFKLLKDLYLDIQAQSMSYPFIALAEAVLFCEHFKIIDRTFKSAYCDVNFVNATSNPKFQQMKGKVGLIRCDFLELLIRIAQYKYLNTGICQNTTESFKKLMELCIKPNIKPEHVLFWQRWREDNLWTLECNDILHANLDSIKQVHSYYLSYNHKYVTHKDFM